MSGAALPNKAEVVEAEVVEAELLSSDAPIPEFTPKKRVRGTAFPPAPIVEGMLASVMAQVKAAADVVGPRLEAPKAKKLLEVRALFVIVYEQIHTACDLMRPYNEASLSPKHRLCRRVLLEMDMRMRRGDLAKAKVYRNKLVAGFAKDLVEFLQAFHIVLSEASTRDMRYDAAEEFCGE